MRIERCGQARQWMQGPSTLEGDFQDRALVFDDQEAETLEDAGIIAKGCLDATKPSPSWEEP
jgi:hypothetical protein